MLRKFGIFTAAAILAAGAAIGSGLGSHALADHINQTTCTPASGNPQFCVTQDGATNSTTTPSGNQNFVFNGTVTVTQTDASGNVVFSETYREHLHTLVKDGVFQEAGDHITGSYSPGPTGGTCTFSFDAHETANGLQYNNSSQSGDCF
jgi:hypothetical protein